MAATLIRLVLIVVTICAANCQNIKYSEILRSHPKLSEDGSLDFQGLAKKYGHPAESYEVVTEDGYLLTLFHLPGDRTRPLLLVHGTTVDADIWLIRGSTSPAITLANKGYDVWVIALRGTIYSQRHLTLNPNIHKQQIFDFSFNEQGVHDLAASIDFVLEKTGQEQLLLIGYSIGTTNSFILAAEKPEYNSKIKAIIALAPMVYMSHVKGANSLCAVYGPYIVTALATLQIYAILGREQFHSYVIQTLCLEESAYDYCVKGMVFSMHGPDEAGFEPEFMSTVFGHYPAEASLKMFEHTIQIIKSGVFQQFDYGPFGNIAKYGWVTPPRYDLEKVTTKVRNHLDG